MLNLEELLIPKNPDKYNQAMVDLLFDKALEKLITKQLEESVSYILDELFSNQKTLTINGALSFYCRVSSYLALEENVKSSALRYNPYIKIEEKKLSINKIRVEKISNKDFFEKFDFNFQILINSQMKFQYQLENSLVLKDETYSKSTKI